GAGGFTEGPGFPTTSDGTGPIAVAVADVNSDGKPDLIIANYLSDDISVVLGDGVGGFTAAADSPIATGGVHPYSVALADVSGDGRPELVTANFGSDDVSVLLGNGAGGFTAAGSPIATGGLGPISVAVADFNGDSSPDVVTANLLSDD